MNVFSDEAFCDRILHLEIVSDPLDSNSDSVESELDSAMDSERNTSNKKQKIENLEEKGDARDLKCCTAVKLKTLHISSGILATQSPFFYKLLKNGMKEPQERVLSLRINASEEAAFMDVVNFMYTGALSGSTTRELLGVLVIADKFEVSSCMSYCCEILRTRNVFYETHETLILYFELPSSVLECAAFKTVLVSAKRRIVDLYKDVLRSHSSRPEAMNLPLCALEVVLGSNRLQVTSEDEVYDFILLWGRTRYPKLEERREILTNLLGRFLHFPSLTMSKLDQIRECPDFDTNEVSKLIMNSLYMNCAAYGQRYHFPGAAGRRPIHRDYRDLPIREVQLESGCVIFWNLTKQNCSAVFGKEVNKVQSQPFLFGGVSFSLYVAIEGDYLGLFVERGHVGVNTFLFNYELAVMKASFKEFVSCLKVDNSTLTSNWHADSAKLFPFRSPGTYLNSDYVVDGVVRIRAEFTIVNSLA